MSDDLRTGRRRVDVTLGLHLDGDDTEVTTEVIIAGLISALEGMGIVVAGAESFTIDHVDQPLHYHSMKRGPVSQPASSSEADLDFSHPYDPNN